MKNELIKANIYEIDAGWRNWFYLEIISKNGLKGYSEIAESNGPKSSLPKITFDLLRKVDLSQLQNINTIKRQLNSFNKQGLGGTVSKCIAAINNALVDIASKNYDLSAVDFLGGSLRNEVPTYWSHCATTRIRSLKFLSPETNQVSKLNDFKILGKEVTDSGFKSLKTNLISLDPISVIMPSYNSQDILNTQNIETVVSDTKNIINNLKNNNKNQVLLDVGYNLSNSSLLTLLKELNQLELGWIEIDFDNFENIKELKESISTPICSGENNVSFFQYFHLINSKIAEIISVDPSWNSVQDILQISKYANFHNQEVTLHNHYSNLSTYIGLSISKLIENFSYLEVDYDDVSWKDELIPLPDLENGKFQHTSELPGWGFQINWDVLYDKLIKSSSISLG